MYKQITLSLKQQRKKHHTKSINDLKKTIQVTFHKSYTQCDKNLEPERVNFHPRIEKESKCQESKHSPWTSKSGWEGLDGQFFKYITWSFDVWSYKRHLVAFLFFTCTIKIESKDKLLRIMRKGNGYIDPASVYWPKKS